MTPLIIPLAPDDLLEILASNEAANLETSFQIMFELEALILGLEERSRDRQESRTDPVADENAALQSVSGQASPKTPSS
jgi:hypothetical protein